MNKLKLMTIVGTRPEIIRLSAVIACADQYFDHILVHTGQNYDYTLNQIFFEELKLREPDYYLDSVGADLGETMGNIIAKSYALMKEVQPEAVLILGDTNSALSAISAKRLKIPIFHMEAGNRCWDYNVSEMINRKIVDHISDINLPYTENSRRYLLSEGIDGKTIFVRHQGHRHHSRESDRIRSGGKGPARDGFRTEDPGVDIRAPQHLEHLHQGRLQDRYVLGKDLREAIAFEEDDRKEGLYLPSAGFQPTALWFSGLQYAADERLLRSFGQRDPFRGVGDVKIPGSSDPDLDGTAGGIR